MGKSFIASKLQGLDVYETDLSNILPDVIKETVIVSGNRNKFPIEEIESRIFGEHITHIVEFKF